MKIYACSPRGYCSGVIRAITMALKARNDNPNKNIYIYGKLVHNEDVIRLLDKNKIITLNPIKNFALLFKGLNESSIIIFTAHGHPKDYEKAALDANLTFIDATCPRVKENMDYIKEAIEENKTIVYIGKDGHPETAAALSISKKVYLFDKNKFFDYSKLNCLSPIILNQTTLSFLDLKDDYNNIKIHFPNAIIKNDICNATLLRQKSILNIPNDVDLIVIVGGSSSSNTQKLVEIAKSKFPLVMVKRVLNVEELKKENLKKYKYAAIAAGTSTSLDKTNEVIDYLKELN